MQPDIVNLRQFYSSPLGKKVKARLARATLAHWPNHKGETIIGMGYTLPVLRVIERTGPDSGHVIPLMPAHQGAIYWPVHSENRSILGDIMRPPFATNTVSRIVMLHAFEHSAEPEELLRITWHLLAPGGQLLLIVPNRGGLWSRHSNNPFSTGTPYTFDALKKMLDDAEFTLREASAALYAPPTTNPILMRLSGLFEMFGRILAPRRGGVLIIEAEKQIYAAVGERVVQRRRAGNWQGATASI